MPTYRSMHCAINITGSGCNHTASDDIPASFPRTARYNVRSQRLIVRASPWTNQHAAELPLYLDRRRSRDKLRCTTINIHNYSMSRASIPLLATTSIPMLAKCIIDCICTAKLDRTVAFFPHNLPYWEKNATIKHQPAVSPFPQPAVLPFPSSP